MTLAPTSTIRLRTRLSHATGIRVRRFPIMSEELAAGRTHFALTAA
jgi:hypothetical protein